MTRPPPDDFVREGRPLAAWIDDLVSDKRATREHAALMIQAMQVGVHDPHVDITAEMLPADPEAHQALFKRAIAATFAGSGDAGHATISRIMDLMEAGRKRWKKIIEADGDLVTSAIGLAKMSDRDFSAVADAVAQQAESAHEHAPIWAEFVFGCLGEPLRGHLPRLEAWLEQRGLEHAAREAIQRMGPAAKSVVPRLLAELDAQARQPRAWWWFNGIAPLVAAAGQDPAIIRQLAERLTQVPAVAGNAIAALGSIEPAAVCAEIPDIIERLLALSRHPEEFVRLAAFSALANLGPGRADVTARLVEAVRTGTNYEPGYAIDTLVPAILPAAEAVPLLIAQFPTFQEFDPDREYQGEYARLAEALTRYGVAAAPAVPTLARHITTDGSWNRSVVDCLAAIGPAAAAALPALQAAALADGKEDLATDDTYIGEAWRAIARDGKQ